MRPTELVAMLRDHDVEISPAQAVEEVKAVAQSEEVLVAPPECLDCGFDGFDHRANLPSRCPECRSERIAEPEFTIDAAEQ